MRESHTGMGCQTWKRLWRKTMSKRWLRRAGFLAVLVCMLLTVPAPARAATAYDEDDIRQTMDQAFANGDLEVSITVDRTFSVDGSQARQEAEDYGNELSQLLGEEALQNGMLMIASSYSWQIVDGHTATYTFDISPQSTKEVTTLTSEKSAYKQALKALKKRDYTTNFYAEDAMYHDSFLLALQHHPEYNYNIIIWKSSDGTFGYRPGDELDTAEIKSKMTKTDEKAAAVIKKIIQKGMTNKKKMQVIHDYLVKNCVYDKGAPIIGYDDAYTAYGCLVKKKAVCQGYAAAFNLLAQKAGICSIAVAGEAGDGLHAWNYVKNGSTFRYIDVTWDDPVPDRGSQAKVSQSYFYVTQKTLEKNHSWDKTEHAKKYVEYASAL